ncbi:MAG: uroporphyrinogen-III synthase [Flavobacteriales bacterium]|jgi:uroporphyrinogen-III synthase
MAKVFLSRSDQNYPVLKKHLAAGCHDLIAQSLIHIEYLDFEMPSSLDWVFFTSRNSVESYFAQKIHGQFKYAALGGGTADALRKHGPVGFIGDESDIVKSALEFRDLIQEERVLFPSSTIGLRTVQNELPTKQVTDVYSYQTSLCPIHVPACEVYVFSSPSNVESFALKNSFPENAVVLVPGQKTKFKVENYYGGNIIDVRSLADSAITDTIFPDILS